MTPTQIKIALYAGALLLAWLCTDRGRAAVARVTRTLEIDANVFSSNFGVATGDVAIDPEMQRLIDRSNAAIAAHDAAHPETL